MELIAPWSSQHLFLVLHQYNDSDDNVLASAFLEKDQPFFPASTNSYISAVSLRISLFGNNDGTGYAYKYLPPEWFIAVDMSDEPDEKADEAQAAWVPSHLGAWTWNFGGEVKTITLVAKTDLANSELGSTVPLHNFTELMCTELNQNKINRDAVIRMPTTGGHFHLKLQSNPTQLVEGPGWGRNGLQTMRGSILEVSDESNRFGEDEDTSQSNVDMLLQYVENGTNNADYDPDESTSRVKSFQIRFEIYKNTLPDNVSVNELKAFLSSGVHIHHKSQGGGAILTVLGPSSIHKVVLAEPVRQGVSFKSNDAVKFNVVGTTKTAAGQTRNVVQGVPIARIFCNDGHFFGDDAPVHVSQIPPYSEAHVPQWDVLGTFTRLDVGEWFVEHPESYTAYLTVTLARNKENGAAQATEFFGGANTPHFPHRFTHFRSSSHRANADDYFVYTTDIRPSIRTVVKNAIVSVEKYNNADPAEKVAYDFNDGEETRVEDLSSPLDPKNIEFRQNVSSHNRIQASTEEPGDYAIQSVNELYEIYNAPLINDKLWNLNTAVNGGFRITLSKTKKVGRLQIDGEFARALGLVPFMKSSGIEKKSDGPQLKTSYIFVEIDDQQPEYSHLNGGEFDDYCMEGQLRDFFVIDPATYEKLNVPDDADLSELKTKILYLRANNRPYRVIDKVNVSFRERRQYIRRTKGEVSYDGVNGREVWTFEDPPMGGYVMNDGTVSPETFSLFEGLIVQIPTLPFQSQEATYASNGQRALLELRFPVEAGVSNDVTGEVRGTSMQLMGDMIWNRSGNHQYLPISSIGNIYTMNARISLVYRNASNRPPQPVYLPPGGIWQLKVLLVETK